MTSVSSHAADPGKGISVRQGNLRGSVREDARILGMYGIIVEVIGIPAVWPGVGQSVALPHRAETGTAQMLSPKELARWPRWRTMPTVKRSPSEICGLTPQFYLTRAGRGG
jgi:hypothetical protein